MTNLNHPNQSSMRVLVTGASGLLGQALVSQLLEAGYIVRAVQHTTSLSLVHNDRRLEVVEADLLDVVRVEEILEEVDFVCHCAGLVSFASARQQELFAINVTATANLINACLDRPIKKVVHVSSVAALGRSSASGMVDEKTPWKEHARNSQYGKSKYLGELEVWRGMAEGLNAVVVNPSIILGPGDWTKGSASIFKKMYDGFDWYTEGMNGFVDVRDVADAMISLMESDIVAERFIVSGDNATYRTVFEQIAAAFGKKPPTKKVTPFLGALACRLEALRSFFTGQEPLITRETMNTSLACYQYDNTKLKKAIPGFTYRSLNDTICYCCDRFQQNLNRQH
ncbi:MAG: SDR family NAD(P)-dependent oxidoreductase [Ferruginibacter sp.]